MPWWKYRGEDSGCHRGVDSRESERKFLCDSEETTSELSVDIVRGSLNIVMYLAMDFAKSVGE